MTRMYIPRMRAAELFAVAVVAWLLSALPGSAQGTSTINPNVPSQNSPLLSAPVRGNFLAAYNDINALYAQAGTMFSGTSCPALKPYQFFANTGGAPTSASLTINDGTACLQWAVMNQTTHQLSLSPAQYLLGASNSPLSFMDIEPNTFPSGATFTTTPFFFNDLSMTGQTAVSDAVVHNSFFFGGNKTVTVGAPNGIGTYITATFNENCQGMLAGFCTGLLMESTAVYNPLGNNGGNFYGGNSQAVVPAAGTPPCAAGTPANICGPMSILAAGAHEFDLFLFQNVGQKIGIRVFDLGGSSGNYTDVNNSYAIRIGKSGSGTAGAATGWPYAISIDGDYIAGFSDARYPIAPGGVLFISHTTSLQVGAIGDFTGMAGGCSVFCWGLPANNPGIWFGAAGAGGKINSGTASGAPTLTFGSGTLTNSAQYVSTNVGFGFLEQASNTGGLVGFQAFNTGTPTTASTSAVFTAQLNAANASVSYGVSGAATPFASVVWGAGLAGIEFLAGASNVLDYNITNAGKWTFGSAIIDTSGTIMTPQIYGGSAAGSALTLTSTSSVSPSGDVLLIRASSIRLQPALGGSNLLDYNTSAANVWTFNAPVVIGTALGTMLNATSTNTGGQNIIFVGNSGTVSNALTASFFTAGLTAGSNVTARIGILGGATPIGQVASLAGVTGGMQIASVAGPVQIVANTSIQFSSAATAVADFGLTNANLWTFLKGTIINIAANDNMYLRGHVSLASGSSITSIDSTLATFKPLEFIGTQFQFTDGGGDRLDFGVTNGTTWTFQTAVSLTSALISRGTPPTGNTGTCSTGVTVTGGAIAGNWTSTSICAIAGTIILTGLPTAPTGYACDAWDITTANVVLQPTASSATSHTWTVRTTATVANDNVRFKCVAY